MVTEPKLLQVPDRVHSVEEMCGLVAKLPNVENIVVIVEDPEGVWVMTVDGTTAERMNWMLDRAKLRLHRAD